MDTFFLPSERMVRPSRGRVALVSQSGGTLVDQMSKFADEGIGLSLGIGIGNKALIGELDLLRYFTRDPETEVIAFYVEGFEKNGGREFVLAAGRCPKPVIVLKAAQYGVVEAKNQFELVSFCEALSCYDQSIEGKIGIVTASGGHGALAVDACFSHGLSVPTLSDQHQAEIKEHVSPRVRTIASFNNPIDLTGSAVDADFISAAKFLAGYQEVDCVLILLLPYTPGVTPDLAARLSQIYRQAGKPLVAYVPHVEKYGIFIEGFEFNRIPVAPSIEGAVHMAEAMRRCKPY